MQPSQLRSLAWLDARALPGASFRELAEEAVRHLRAEHPHYHWVGIYMVEGALLRLWSWDGPAATQHVEIPLDQGVCGYAASTGRVANVPDVEQDPRYLQCFLGTRSELVVPIRSGERVFGEIDIDSDRLAAFDDGDEAFLSAFGSRLAELAADAGLQGHVPG